ncbi:Usa1p NDAI_0C00830 [Naumovozyma dairenensis CBS 421]|uniref:Uncharacterized protein n=1 Tax=Naumovozyma dairenensis (strain ATCC 10597 / BCRC 20456 / CBS 421 / NBRC 0211 / NRRL Y-12639) TaxID=1071378 RepID=G0W7I3_NAUDC|nr:hypothetical protein NDAI_0C00830 [Naumovozyma dairenensis CBS 421]CCD23744.1 hypothetical protein NDAI_0C00830 [Naumovozyma dairenensis CBS 421]
MECIIEPPVHVFITSTNLEWIPDGEPININIHPKTPLYRVLQYVHSRLPIQLGPITNYCLKYNEEEVDLSQLCDTFINEGNSGRPSATPNDNNTLFFQFEKTENEPHSSINLNYDRILEFKKIDLILKINSLSRDKFVTVVAKNSPIETTSVKNLLQFALDSVIQYEIFSSDRVDEHGNYLNICQNCEAHNFSDFTHLQIKGSEKMLTLNEMEPSSLEDMKLDTLLDYTFLPAKNDYLTVMLKMNHKQEHDETCVKLEFISDIALSDYEMWINPQTTVLQVKHFISCLYTHSKDLNVDHIRLIYKGHLLGSIDGSDIILNSINSMRRDSNSSSHIHRYNGNNSEIKLHIQFDAEHLDLNHDFWDKPLRSSSAHHDDSRQSSKGSSTQENVDDIPVNNEQSSHIEESVLEEQNCEEMLRDERKPLKLCYETESGEPIETTTEIYKKCFIDGKECFIELSELEIKKYQLIINSKIIPLYSHDIQILTENNTIKLSPKVINEIESTLALKVKKNQYKVLSPSSTIPVEPTRTIHIDSNNDAENVSIIQRLREILPFGALLVRTFILLIRNSFITLFVLVEFGTLLPYKYTILLALIMIGRTLWTTREICDLWSAYFHLKEIDDTKINKILSFLEGQTISPKYFKKLINDKPSLDSFLISELKMDRIDLYINHNTFTGDDNELANIETDISRNADEKSLKQTLEKVIMTVTEGINEDEDNDGFQEKKDLIDDTYQLFIKCVNNYQVNKDNMDPVQLENSKLLMFSILREIDQVNMDKLPIYKRIFEKIIIQLEKITDMRLLERIIPDPRTDNIIMATLKNISLFILLLIPGIAEKLATFINRQHGILEAGRHQERQEAESQRRADVHALNEENTSGNASDTDDDDDDDDSSDNELDHLIIPDESETEDNEQPASSEEGLDHDGNVDLDERIEEIILDHDLATEEVQEEDLYESNQDSSVVNDNNIIETVRNASDQPNDDNVAEHCSSGVAIHSSDD